MPVIPPLAVVFRKVVLLLCPVLGRCRCAELFLLLTSPLHFPLRVAAPAAALLLRSSGKALTLL